MKKSNRTPKRTRIERLCAVFIALLIWQAAAMILDESILLATPIRVAKELCELVVKADFWSAIWFSFKRIIIGYFLALTIGAALAVVAARFHAVESLLWPFISMIKATPVASLIILCLIWLNVQNLSIFISFLMVIPIIYTNILQGLLATDGKLLEMAEVFKLNWSKQFVYIYLPQLRPYLLSACSLSLGIAWKSGVAAEVIGIPSGSIGEMLYEAKLYLDSPQLFAWTAVIIVVSIAFEKMFMLLLKRFYKRLEAL